MDPKENENVQGYTDDPLPINDRGGGDKQRDGKVIS
jgi:hypothetical protein